MMRTSSSLLTFMATPLLLAFACGDDGDTNVEPDADPGVGNVDVAADITSDTTWTKDNVYHLKPKAGDQPYILVSNNATLTIQPGTQIVGSERAALIVTRGSKLMAVGTAAEPIVFSHDAPNGQRESGKWGGIVIMGRATVNHPGGNPLFEALPESIGEAGHFGQNGPTGGDDMDDSGELRYVRVEFAGFPYLSTKEFNGITFCGVGRGTKVEYVQVHRGNDDGMEFFGGTVDVRHVVLSQNDDDGFDTDNGYVGRAQFVVVQHTLGRSSDPNGLEMDNNDPAIDGDFLLTPTSHPILSNFTVIGNGATTPSNNFGIVARRGTQGEFYNFIITNFGTAAIEVRDARTAGYYPAYLRWQGSVFFDNIRGTSVGNWSSAQTDFDEAAAETIMSSANLNLELALVPPDNTLPPLLESPLSTVNPSFKLKTDSAALTAGVTPPTTGDSFFEPSATYAGAIGDADWTLGWTSYPQD